MVKGTLKSDLAYLCSFVLELAYLRTQTLSVHHFQSDYQGVDGPLEPGPLPALQHPAPTDSRPDNPATSHTFLIDHPRIWISSHCGSADRHPELPERESQDPREELQPPPEPPGGHQAKHPVGRQVAHIAAAGH